MKTLPPPTRLPALRQLIMPLDARSLDGLTRAQRVVVVASLEHRAFNRTHIQRL